MCFIKWLIPLLCPIVNVLSSNEVSNSDNRIHDFFNHKHENIDTSDSDKLQNVEPVLGTAQGKMRLKPAATVRSNSSIIPQPIYPDCHSFMMELGDFSSEFFKCSVQHSRPFRMCQNCVDQYEKTYNIYQEIIKDNTRDDACQHMLLNADRVMVITQVVKSVTNIWELADCPKCFNTVSEDVNGTIHHTLSNDTTMFLNMFQNMSDCLSFNASELNPSNVDQLESNPNSSACIVCKNQYNDMNDHFMKMLKDSSQHVCMDVVDMMNYTRIKWSQEFHCSHRTGYDAPIILITIVMCTLTFLFYCVNQVVAQRKERKLMKQKRLILGVDRRLPTFPHGSLDSSETSDDIICNQHT